MAKEIFNIPPDQTLMEDIGATSFTLAEAIVELVANSIDARPVEKIDIPSSRVEVDVNVSAHEVTVIDNAQGMSKEVLVQAVRLGVKMDDILGKRKRKGMYGLGLKTAAASIGRYWAILTRPIGSSKDYFLEFDLEKYGKSNSTGKLSDWTIEIETLNRVKDSLLGERQSGTAIIIRKLRDSLTIAGSVTRKLGEAYKPHIEAGDIIKVNGEVAAPPTLSYLEGSLIKFDEVVSEPSKGWRVYGWVALDSKTHNDGEYGFNLYRQDQLIEVWDKSWFRAHLMTSRIVGEAHLDYMPVNFNKQGFKTQSEAWRLTSEHMTKYLKPVSTASQKANTGKKDEKKTNKVIEGLQRAMQGMPKLEEEDVDEDNKRRSLDTKEESKVSNVEVKASCITIKGHEIIPSYGVEEWDTEVTPWDYISENFDEGKRTEVRASINTGSLLYKRSKEPEILARLALAECVTRYLVEVCSIPSIKAREIRDEWIYKSLLDSSCKKEDVGDE